MFSIPSLIEVVYIAAVSLFILGLKAMSVVRTARRGNALAALGMFLACLATLAHAGILNYRLILIGVAAGSLAGALPSYLVRMTAMPQLVAIFNGFGGLASTLVACSEFLRVGSGLRMLSLVTVIAGSIIGLITFTGSVIAFMKLQRLVIERPLVYPLQKTINFTLFLIVLVSSILFGRDPSAVNLFVVLIALSAVLGVLLVLPIGGADMPVIISFLNSLSGVAAAMTGFVVMNSVLIVAGSLVGAAGLILTNIMCRAMNRTLVQVVFGAFGAAEAPGKTGGEAYIGVKSTSAEEAAMILDAASSILVVPGYGLAVARAQHALAELARLLESRGVEVRYAIHPVAGRMPGHMNVLLAEADVPYDKLYEMDQINSDFAKTDVALVIGANDVCNPVARTERGSPIYGMPILNVDEARSVIVIKRTLSPGFAGIKNPLFEKENTVMLFEDAKRALENLFREVKSL